MKQQEKDRIEEVLVQRQDKLLDTIDGLQQLLEPDKIPQAIKN